MFQHIMQHFHVRDNTTLRVFLILLLFSSFIFWRHNFFVVWECRFLLKSSTKFINVNYNVVLFLNLQNLFVYIFITPLVCVISWMFWIGWQIEKVRPSKGDILISSFGLVGGIWRWGWRNASLHLNIFYQIILCGLGT